MSKVIDVAAGLVFRNGQLLITQRRPGDHLGGLWEFPGGKVEPNETFEHCLARELREELGIDVRVGAQVDEITHSYPEKTVRLRFFRCELVEGEPQPIHCHATAWVTAESIPDFEFPAADEQLLRKLKADHSFWIQ
ncbi:MAG TPA: 8-oxo-dGTP diphosphatase MutT [Verrucomicrobiae bacterium]